MKLSIFRTIKGRITLLVIFLVLFLGIGGIILSYSTLYRNLENSVIQNAESNLSYIADSINQKLNDIDNYTKWCQQNRDILSFVTTTYDSGDYPRITRTAKSRLEEEFLYNPSNAYMDRIIIANAGRSDFLQYSPSNFSTAKPLVNIITALPYYESTLSRKEFNLNVQLQQSEIGATKRNIFPFLRSIYNPYGTDSIGFIYVEIAPELFYNSMRKYPVPEGASVYLTIADTTYQVEDNFLTEVAPVFDSIQEKPKKLLADSSKFYELMTENGKQSLVTLELNTADCYLSQTIPPKLLQQTSGYYLMFIILILLTAALFGILLYFLFSRIVTHPIAVLNARLDCIAKGDFSRDESIEWDNELGAIGKNINKLSTDISVLIKKKVEDEKLKKDYEYKMLQSQINPHFLYNTLNSIKWMATLQNASGIAQMVTALSRLLKNLAKGSSTIVTIGEEFNLLDDYFLIQKYRYGGAIQLDYQIDDEYLLNNEILRFTLQPIVENAIFHGIEPKGNEGFINIRLFENELRQIQIDITDNGIGMEDSLIQHVLSENKPAKSSFFKDVGISNVNKRLQYTFGDSYGIRIKSVPSDHTTMTILLKKTVHTVESEESKCTS